MQPAPGDPSIEHLLTVYQVERQDHQVQGNIQLAIVGAALAYGSVIIGMLADPGAHISDAALFLVPVPLFALCSYLILSAANSLQRATYLVALEHCLERIMVQPAELRVPSAFRRSEIVFGIFTAPWGLRTMIVATYASIAVIEAGLIGYAFHLAHAAGLLIVYGLWMTLQGVGAWNAMDLDAALQR